MSKVSRVRRLLAVALLVALAGASVALAARGDPQKRINRADQARAKAMLVRQADLNAAFAAVPRGAPGSDFYCAAIDESDLVVTGEAWSPSFTSTAEVLASTAYVYRSRADANASWKRGTSAAGERCLRRRVQEEVRGPGVRVLSFRRIPFPGRAQRSLAYRLVAAQQGIRVHLDVIAMQHSRAQAGIVYGSALAPPPRAEELRLSALVAKRMAAAMRGG